MMGRVTLLALLGVPAWATEQPAPMAQEQTATRTILVPATALPKGAVITQSDLSATTVPANRVFESTAATEPDLLGKQTLRALPAGQPISALHLRTPPTISRGALVPFAYVRGAVQLHGQAQALEDGVAGHSIRLLNTATRATLQGKVQANGSVLVN
ncbi:MAG: flagellar basal body P-ring formation chaperone FlgA [Pseudomonadota bacterium]|jgi:flagella basal body P-ring formation protein FlgA